jgi:hypothetical protein
MDTFADAMDSPKNGQSLLDFVTERSIPSPPTPDGASQEERAAYHARNERSRRRRWALKMVLSIAMCLVVVYFTVDLMVKLF